MGRKHPCGLWQAVPHPCPRIEHGAGFSHGGERGKRWCRTLSLHELEEAHWNCKTVVRKHSQSTIGHVELLYSWLVGLNPARSGVTTLGKLCSRP